MTIPRAQVYSTLPQPFWNGDSMVLTCIREPFHVDSFRYGLFKIFPVKVLGLLFHTCIVHLEYLSQTYIINRNLECSYNKAIH